jgi:hypothetical protein
MFWFFYHQVGLSDQCYQPLLLEGKIYALPENQAVPPIGKQLVTSTTAPFRPHFLSDKRVKFLLHFLPCSLSKPHTVYVGRVCPAAGCKTNFQICIEVKPLQLARPTRNLVEFKHTPAGHTRPTYTVCGLLYSLSHVIDAAHD